VKSAQGELVQSPHEKDTHTYSDMRGIRLLTAAVNLGSVGVNIVGLDHSLCSKYFSTLVVSERRLTADINHGLNATGVPNKAGRSIKSFRALKGFNPLVNVARSNGENINGVRSGKEASHVQVMDSHVGEDTATALNILKRRRSRVTRTQFDLRAKKLVRSQH
jgi:hypothetical protein